MGADSSGARRSTALREPSGKEMALAVGSWLEQ